MKSRLILSMTMNQDLFLKSIGELPRGVFSVPRPLSSDYFFYFIQTTKKNSIFQGRTAFSFGTRDW